MKEEGLTSLLNLLLIATLTSASLFASHAELVEKTLALWHFDEIQTPEATGDNFGILGGDPPPMLVEGKFGKALSFDGNNFVYVPFTSNLYAPYDITIEAWVYVKGFRNTPYNNILTIAHRTGLEWTTVTRVCGIAVAPEAGEVKQADRGYLRGYVYTDREHFNEIVSSKPVIPVSQWVHVAFVRSLAAGLHLYVNGEEVKAVVTCGVKNPKGKIVMGTEIIMGHDAEIIIDEPRICNVALQPSQFISSAVPEIVLSRTEIDIGPNLMIVIIVVAIALAVAWLLRRVIQTWGLRSSGP